MALPKTARWLANISDDVSAAKREHEAGAEAAIAAGLPSESSQPELVVLATLVFWSLFGYREVGRQHWRTTSPALEELLETKSCALWSYWFVKRYVLASFCVFAVRSWTIM